MLAELEKINSILAQLMKGLTAYEEKCEGIKIQINTAEDELKKAEQALRSVVTRRISAEREVRTRESNVEAFRRQLLAAEKALASSKITLINIK